MYEDGVGPTSADSTPEACCLQAAMPSPVFHSSLKEARSQMLSPGGSHKEPGHEEERLSVARPVSYLPHVPKRSDQSMSTKKPELDRS